MASVKLTGNFAHAIYTTPGTVNADGPLTFRLHASITSGGRIYLPEKRVVTISNQGLLDVNLAVPDVPADQARYSVILLDGSEHYFHLSSTDGPTANIYQILITNAL